MKRSKPAIIGAVILGLIVLSPKTARSEDQALSSTDTAPLKKAGVPWSKKMQELYKTLSDLLTDVSSDHRFNDPANKYRIENEANRLASAVHDLSKKGMVSLDADPTIPLVAGMLGRETKRAAAELKLGHRAYARSILRSVPGYCMACHTRNASGPQFAQLPLEPSSRSLTSLEKGEFFTASRQFDRAQSEFLKVIEDPVMAVAYDFVWEKAIHDSLINAVRVKQDPAQAAEIVQAVLDMKNGHSSIKEDAKIWKVSIQEWQQEIRHEAMSDEGLYAEATMLMAKAKETQKYPMDRTADILYLRASAVLHDLLQAAPNGPHAEEALLLAGLSYEVLSPLKSDELHELYYEACIRKAPHTGVADICFRRLEQSMFLGFTGSSGVVVPEDVREKLAELRTLSQPVANIQK